MKGRAGKGSRESGPGRGGGADKESGRGRRGLGGRAGGACVCPSCGKRTPHQRGVPCSQVKCSECASTMTRGK